MDHTSDAQISKPRKIRAGLYRGTLTVCGRAFTYEIERGEVGWNCDSGDGGWWRTILNNDSSSWDYHTLASALQSLGGCYEISPVWGLVRI